LDTTAFRSLAAALLVACGPSGSPSDSGTDDCSTRVTLALSGVVVDGSSSTATPSVAFDLEISNPTSTPARILGYVLECLYRSPDRSMLRGSGTSDTTVDPGESWTLSEPACLPGIVDWMGDPDGDDLNCTVELLYEYEGCEDAPPRTTTSVTGSDDITVVYP
jgi:hypothetical protein